MADPSEMKRLAESYRAMEDEELLRLFQQSDQLTDAAWEALAAEIGRRGLSDTPVSRDEVEGRPLEEVGHFYLLSEAEMAKALLDSAGIPSFLTNQNAARIYVPLAVQGMSLRVDPQNVEAAKEILATVPDEPESNEDEPDVEPR